MTEQYKSRENTAWWNVKVAQIIREGENLKGRDLESLLTIENVYQYINSINDWLQRITEDVRHVYFDQSLADQYCRPVEHIDFEGTSLWDIINIIKETIDERIRGFQDLRSKTI